MHAKDVKIEFNGITFNEFHNGIIPESNCYIANNLVEGFSSPEITPNVSDYYSRDGASHGQSSYDRTTVLITGHIVADTQEDQKKMKDALSSSLALPLVRDSLSDGFSEITITDELGRVMKNRAKVFQSVSYKKDFGDYTRRDFVFGLEFEKNFFVSAESIDTYSDEEDHFEYLNIGLVRDDDDSLDEVSGIPFTHDGEGVPFYYNYKTLEVVNEGNYDTPLYIEIQEGAINPIVHNITTGVTFSVEYTVLQGEKLVIDAENGLVYVLLANGEKINKSNLVDLSSQWVFLKKGNNTIRVYDNTKKANNFLFSLKHKNSFISI